MDVLPSTACFGRSVVSLMPPGCPPCLCTDRPMDDCTRTNCRVCERCGARAFAMVLLPTTSIVLQSDGYARSRRSVQRPMHRGLVPRAAYRPFVRACYILVRVSGDAADRTFERDLLTHSVSDRVRVCQRPISIVESLQHELSRDIYFYWVIYNL